MVTDHELDVICPVAEIYEEIAGLLGCPWPGWMQDDSEGMDALGRVLDHSQDGVEVAGGFAILASEFLDQTAVIRTRRR